MQVKRGIERPDGSFVFQGTLEGAELDFVIEVGMNELARIGALPFVSRTSFNAVDIHPLTDTEN